MRFLMIIGCSEAQTGPGLTTLTLLTHVHTVTIMNEQTGATYTEISGPAVPLEGETVVSVARHRHLTTDGYLNAPQ